jgi:hypothetical protein
METLTFSSEQTAIRFAIDGNWTAEEFAAFLRDTSDAYARINSLFVLREAIDAEARFNEQARGQSNYDGQVFTWQAEVFGRSHHHPMGIIGMPAPPSFERVIELTRSVSQPLAVDAISYASPGWIQLIGDWNPLKVLSEFITKWRAENTKRDANRMKFENDRLRIQAELAAKLLDAAPKMERHHEGGTSRLIDMAESVIKPATAYVQRIGSDSRVIDVELARPGEELPPPRFPQ